MLVEVSLEMRQTAGTWFINKLLITILTLFGVRSMAFTIWFLAAVYEFFSPTLRLMSVLARQVFFVKSFPKASGYGFIRAADGKCTIKAAEMKSHDVIVRNLILRDISGREVCQHLKSSEDNVLAKNPGAGLGRS